MIGNPELHGTSAGVCFRSGRCRLGRYTCRQIIHNTQCLLRELGRLDDLYKTEIPGFCPLIPKRQRGILNGIPYTRSQLLYFDIPFYKCIYPHVTIHQVTSTEDTGGYTGYKQDIYGVILDMWFGGYLCYAILSGGDYKACNAEYDEVREKA